MDPLSISASVLTLIQAASVTTTFLREFVESIKHADSKLSELDGELTRLAGHLTAIDGVMAQCQNGNALLLPVHDDIWQKSLEAVKDCKMSLEELEELVNSIKKSPGFPRLWRSTRTTLALNLRKHEPAIDGLRDKIQKSNWGLQTILLVFNVSLSLRSNESQDKIMLQLARLKQLIENSPFQTIGQQFNSAITRNLQGLAHAAKVFHSTASTTASTIRRQPSIRPLQSFHELSGTMDWMPSVTRERIGAFLNSSPLPLTRHHSTSSEWFSGLHPVRDYNYIPMPQSPRLLRSTSLREEVDIDDELDSIFLTGFEEQALTSIHLRDFSKAETLLNMALNRHGQRRGDNAVVNRLRIQLSLCYILLGKWQHAEPLIQKVAQTEQRSDLTIPNLLHALAFGRMMEFSFNEAFKLCKQSLSMKRKFLSTDSVDYLVTLGLLASVHDLKDEPEHGDVLRRSMPHDFFYSHPPDIISLIKNDLRLLESVFGIPAGSDLTPPAEYLRTSEIDTSREILRASSNQAEAGAEVGNILNDDSQTPSHTLGLTRTLKRTRTCSREKADTRDMKKLRKTKTRESGNNVMHECNHVEGLPQLAKKRRFETIRRWAYYNLPHITITRKDSVDSSSDASGDSGRQIIDWMRLNSTEQRSLVMPKVTGYFDEFYPGEPILTAPTNPGAPEYYYPEYRSRVSTDLGYFSPPTPMAYYGPVSSEVIEIAELDGHSYIANPDHLPELHGCPVSYREVIRPRLNIPEAVETMAEYAWILNSLTIGYQSPEETDIRVEDISDGDTLPMESGKIEFPSNLGIETASQDDSESVSQGYTTLGLEVDMKKQAASKSDGSDGLARTTSILAGKSIKQKSKRRSKRKKIQLKDNSKSGQNNLQHHGLEYKPYRPPTGSPLREGPAQPANARVANDMDGTCLPTSLSHQDHGSQLDDTGEKDKALEIFLDRLHPKSLYAARTSAPLLPNKTTTVTENVQGSNSPGDHRKIPAVALFPGAHTSHVFPSIAQLLFDSQSSTVDSGNVSNNLLESRQPSEHLGQDGPPPARNSQENRSSIEQVDTKTSKIGEKSLITIE